MRRKYFLVLCPIIFLFIHSACYADNYFIDNEGGNDNNGGTSWSDAYQSLDQILIQTLSQATPNARHNYYIKATDTPYRKVKTIYGAYLLPNFFVSGNGNFFFDATGNINNPTERSEKRSKLYGSAQIPADGWLRLTSPSNPEQYYYAESPFKDRLLEIQAIAALYIDGVEPVKIERAEHLYNMKNNQYYYMPDTQSIYYRNDTIDPSTLAIEWLPTTVIGIEGSRLMKVYGADLRYFNHGYIQGSCEAEEIADVDVSYSLDTGVIISSNFEGGGVFRNISSHHNGKDGIHVQGYNNTKVFNSVAYANARDGFVLIPIEYCDVPNTAFVSNNTSSNNGGVGFRVFTEFDDWNNFYAGERWDNPAMVGLRTCTTWVLGNNISSNNLSGEYFLENNQTPGFFFNNGWYGSSNNQLFTDNSGFMNLDNIDPMFADPESGDFHLMPDSPYINSGINLGLVVDDFDGELRDIIHPDIGADEYVAP